MGLDLPEQYFQGNSSMSSAQDSQHFLINWVKMKARQDFKIPDCYKSVDSFQLALLDL